ncbi:FAD-dependent oxidoreductase [Pseudomonas sp. G.S.17]|uniref:FAD-dependent oxidoreductase n=1 Tax=Pseudomonas sp. G.S.17 TaxID=3137451 RepID=UPI00311CA200
MKSFTDVLICGAGAAGLTLAIDLARRGVAFRLLEKMPAPFHGSRGKGIQPRTQEVFEDLGIIDRAAAAGGLYPPARKYLADGSFTKPETTESARHTTPSEPYQQPLMLPQFLTEAVMRERLAELGHYPEYACELVGLKQSDKGVEARIASPEGENILQARYLVGADGGRSFVRSAVGIGFPGATLGIRAVVADIVLKGLTRDAWHQFGSGAQQLHLCPLAGTELFQLQAPIPTEGDVDLSAAGLEVMVTERTGRTDIEIASVHWASAYSMNARLADFYRVGNVFLVGDAAHIHPPTGGQGLNTSVQDSYNLGWKLAAALAGPSDKLLDTYEEERRPIAEGMLKLAIKLLDASKTGENRRGREVQQLDIGYPDSSLSLQQTDRTRELVAGARAPDAQIRGAGGQPTRLFELFKGTHWTLLGYQTSRCAMPVLSHLRTHIFGPGGDVIDECGQVSDAYGLSAGDWVLVRPDCYIAAIVSSAREETLKRYISSMVSPPSRF